METVEYTVERINLLSFSPPTEPVEDLPEPEYMMWHYSYKIAFTPFSATRICLTPRFHCFLYRKEDAEKKPIISIETSTEVSVSISPSAEGKFNLLTRALNIGIWNLQGIYAAKTEHLSMPGMPPPSLGFLNHSETLKKEINEHWK